MLMGVSPVISPELLVVLDQMGHGDELVLSDAFFPANSCNARVLRADGISVPDLLSGILRLVNLDTYVASPVCMMAPVKGDSLDPEVEKSYRAVIDRYYPDTPPIEHIERFEFYERSRKTFAVVVTGTTAKYGNIIIKKGVVPVAQR